MTHLDRFQALVEPGIVGTFTHCEVTEIFALVEGARGPQNIFTLAVAEERDVPIEPVCLNGRRLRLPELKCWTIGIRQSVMPLADFERVLEDLEKNNVWSTWGATLSIGSLHQVSSQFVPPDQARPVSLNKILKNNFWNGSHILEWADGEKSLFKALFDRPERAEALATALMPFVPIDLGVMSDRLGNIIVQIPVTILTTQCGEARNKQGYNVRVAWRPNAVLRPLRIAVTADYDGTVTGLATDVVKNDPITLPFPESPAEPKAYLLDEARNILLGATGPLSGFSQIAMKIHIVGRAEPRTFEYRDRKGRAHSKRVALRPPRHDMVVGEPRSDANGGFTGRRLYRLDTERVRTERLFEQYGLPDTDPAEERTRAIGDLLYLINQHGEEGAWLWDPYLDATDILETLFLSPHGGANLRGLSRGKNVKDENIEAFIESQRNTFAGMGGNLLGLFCEFRVAHNLEHVDFHDRFLIFPKKEGGDLAWSLGTSVNTLGAAHHILQRVEDGQRVGDAFRKLWERMGAAQTVWKHP